MAVATAERNGRSGTGSAYSNSADRGTKRIDPESVESDLEPGEIEGIAPPISDKDSRIVALIDTRARDSTTQRRPYDGRSMECLAFFNGNPWGRWNGSSLDDTRDLNNPDRVYSSHNKLRPVVAHLTTRAMAAAVDVVFKPKPGPQSVIGTRQMRSVWNHVLKANDWESLHTRLQENAVIVGQCYCQVTYDTSKWVEIPEFDPQSPDPNNPEIIDVHDAQLGEISLDFVGANELLIDPKALIRYEAEWMILEKRRSLNYIKSKWPDEGKWVTGDGELTNAEVLRDGATLVGRNRVGKTLEHTAVVRTLWELPTPGVYPKGRYIVTAGKRVLENEDYLYPEMAKQRLFPFCALPYRNGIETVWGDNALYPLLDPQRDYNRGISKIGEHTKRGDGKLLFERGSEVDAKAFRSEARDEVIAWTRVDPRFPNIEHTEPKYIELAPLDPNVMEQLRIADEDIKAISSVNDPSLGNGKGDLSGVAINALQEGDQSEGRLFQDNDRRMVSEIATLVGILAKQFYLKDEARLIYVQDTAPVGKPAPVFPQPQQSPNGAQGGPQGAMPPMPGGVGLGGAPGPQQGPQNASPTADGLSSLSPGLDDPMDSPVMEAMIFSHLGRGRWVVETTATASMSESAKRQVLMQLQSTGAFTPAQLPATMVLLREFGLLSSDETMDDLKQALTIMMQMTAPAAPPDPMAVAQAQAQIQTQVATAKTQADTQGKMQLAEQQRALDAQYGPQISLSLAGKASPAEVLSMGEKAGLDPNGAASHLAQVVNTLGVGADVAHFHHPDHPAPVLQPNPQEQAVNQAQIDQANAEHGAGLQTQQAAATQAMTPPAPEAPQPDVEGDHARAKDMESHKSNLKIAEIEAAARVAPKPTTGGK